MSKKYTATSLVRVSLPMLALLFSVVLGCGGTVSEESDAALSDLSTKDSTPNARSSRSQGRGGAGRSPTAELLATTSLSVQEPTVSSGTTSSPTSTFAAATGGASDSQLLMASAPLTNATTTISTVTSGRKLLQASDFTLLGRFTLPLGGSGMDSTTYSRGGMTMGAEGVAPSLYITGARGNDIAYGGDPDVRVGEVNIPSTFSKSSNFADLPRGTFRQPMTNVLEGRIRDVFDPSTPDSAKLEVQIRGLLKVGNELLVNAIMFYDNNSISVAGHFIRSADLSVKGAVAGPVRVAPQVGVRHAPGPMFKVPSALRQTYGWPAVATGVNGLSINNSISNGPGLILYEPSQIRSASMRSAIPGTVLADYPYPGKSFAETMGFRFSMTDGNPLNQNPWWTAVNHTRGGGLWPETHETVAFAGFRGMGAPYYGDPTRPPIWGVVDPLSIHSAPHAYPYQHVLYLFDQNEYIAVHNGQKLPNEVKAYAVVELPDSFGPASLTYMICGSAYDASVGRFYVMKCGANSQTGESVVEVYQLPR